ncbi:NAD(P)H-dependent oxidoreductase subunit E [Telmatocola sphagniphila]|uniref:NAD(P)H-dependent oxidoreductase subunit E n=1 Tax=Telmatocola sphagniphila TaxID=1123043 RepID=A0A8E6B7B7_9BACT|nr:NAD(P)H-dependent oxidoreductase subunit E [Telmatocola sphagniphila]QVL31745.1 NAD(P)H-dependent oxidoreductase subunit E [Telmatocola sphagniphila]
MDLHIHGDTASPQEREAVDGLLGPAPSAWMGGLRNLNEEGRIALVGGQESRTQRHRLIEAFHAVQGRIGWVSEGALNYICQRLSVPPAEAYGVATFYHLFSLSPRPSTVVHVCDDIACRIKGGENLCQDLEKTLGPSGSGSWQRSPCLGLCERAPAALTLQAATTPRGITLAPTSGEEITQGLKQNAWPVDEPFQNLSRSIPPSGSRELRLLKRIGKIDPESIEAYILSGGYARLKQALALGSEGVIREVLDSKLMGRGGAAFPTGRKWEAVAKAPAKPHYLVCNADESEPGTFKDRLLMEGDPFAVLEGMTIAGLATGCEKGFLYLRGEYPLAGKRLALALDLARFAGFLGENILESGLNFDIEIRRGAGAYICGEETALFNSIEGKRGEPRNKPPFPVQEGVFGKPTVINNVETLVNIPLILKEGGKAYAQLGTESSTGPKLFCLSGHVARPGVYETTFGPTLRQMIEIAGGVPEGRKIQAILLGGAAGVFVGPDQLDIPLTFEGTRAANATLGSGVIIIFDDRVDMTDILTRIAEFFRAESCGQCVPCRVGTVRQEELFHRLRSQQPLVSREEELNLLKEIGQVMRDASICGLGQTASSAVESALKNLKGLFAERGQP